MRNYKDLIKDLNSITNNFCCIDTERIQILVNHSDMKLLDNEVLHPEKKHCIYGIPIELGYVETPSIGLIKKATR